MRRLISIAFLSLFLFGCDQEPTDSYVIDGKAEGVFNGMRVYLSTLDERGAPVPKDTAIVMNETFSLKGSVEYPMLHYVTINGTPGRLPVMLENGNSSIIIDKKILSDSKYTGSESHDVFNAYEEELKILKDNIIKAEENLSESTFLNDKATIASDQKVYEKTIQDLEAFRYNFIENNLNSYAVLPIFKAQVRTRDIEFDKFVNLFDRLDDKIKNSKDGKDLKIVIDRIKVILEAEKSTAIGAVAPKFSAPTPNGELLALDDVVSKGKVTIIDFWAAWCGPCRRENPNVVRVYEKFHDKGLEIIGVGLDGRRGQQKPKEAWVKAIEKDNLTWHQVSNLRYFDEIAALYNVRSIPSMFVLDSEGKIIAKNLRGVALENKIADLLN